MTGSKKEQVLLKSVSMFPVVHCSSRLLAIFHWDTMESLVERPIIVKVKLPG